MTKDLYGVPVKVHNKREGKYVAIIEYKMACIAEKSCTVMERELENDARTLYSLEMISNDDMYRLLDRIQEIGAEPIPRFDLKKKREVPRFDLSEYRDTV